MAHRYSLIEGEKWLAKRIEDVPKDGIPQFEDNCVKLTEVELLDERCRSRERLHRRDVAGSRGRASSDRRIRPQHVVCFLLPHV